MARQASGSLVIQHHVEERITGRGVGGDVARMPHNFDLSRSYESGTSPDQIDRVYSSDVGATVDGTGVTLDVVGTTLADRLDASLTVSVVKLRTLVIRNLGTVGNLLVGGSTHPIGLHADATGIDVIEPGGALIRDFGTAGLACVAATSDEIKIAASAGTVAYSAMFTGCSA